MREKLTAILKQYWGYEEFRPMQYEVISSVLSGCDTLALMPTGGGKSITYQLPTLATDGLCIVVTPLIALMKDQVDNLRRRGISAAAVHSGMSKSKIDRLLDNCAYGDVKFLYVSPERLNTDIFQMRLRLMKVTLIAVDEAHCISEWGYDFRPSYLHISQLREFLPDVPILALTASATGEVAKDIMKRLCFRGEKVLRSSFARPNISYVVRKTEAKEEQIMRILNGVPGSGIIYVRRRGVAEYLTEYLQNEGVSASYYHGGLPSEERSIRQDEWLSGKVRVMVATNAFGMGIDKRDVRFVIHYTMCDTMESYYQEAGRAGRDGLRSYATLLVSSSDYTSLKRRVDNDFPPIERVKEVYEQICSYLMIAVGDGKGGSYLFNLHDFCRHHNYFTNTILGVIDLLERNEYLTYIEEAANPARLIFAVRRDELYKTKFSQRTEQIVLAILRMYNGVFTEFKPINEMAIASWSGYTDLEVKETLAELRREKIIRYIPSNTSPIIYMNEERLPTSDLYIAPNTYTERKKQMLSRLEAMVGYAENENLCRSLIIERYFGDDTGKECGSCDICLARKRGGGDKGSVEEKIVEALSFGERFTLHQLLRQVSAAPEAVTKALYALSDHGVVAIEECGVVSLLSDRGSEK